MNPFDFAGEVILASASGVLSPGPLFFTNIIYGSKQGAIAGFKIAFGHTIVEFPLIITLSLGLFTFSQVLTNNENLKIIGVIGGIAMIAFSLTQIISVASNQVKSQGHNQGHNHFLGIGHAKKPILLGVIFSGLNPFFLIWWFTIGLKLISDSIQFFGLAAGILFLFSFHIWMDYAWLVITSYLAFKTVSVLNTRFYLILLLSLSSILGLFGAYTILTIL